MISRRSSHQIPIFKKDNSLTNKERIDNLVADLVNINVATYNAMAESGAGSEPALLHLGRALNIAETIKKNWYVHKAELGDMFDHPQIMRTLCTSYTNVAMNY